MPYKPFSYFTPACTYVDFAARNSKFPVPPLLQTHPTNKTELSPLEIIMMKCHAMLLANSDLEHLSN